GGCLLHHRVDHDTNPNAARFNRRSAAPIARGAAGLPRRPSTNPVPAGATDAGSELDVGTGNRPVPPVRPPAGGARRGTTPPPLPGPPSPHPTKLPPSP